MASATATLSCISQGVALNDEHRRHCFDLIQGKEFDLAMKLPEFLTRTGDDKCQLLFVLPWNRVELALTRMETTREVN